MKVLGSACCHIKATFGKSSGVNADSLRGFFISVRFLTQQKQAPSITDVKYKYRYEQRRPRRTRPERLDLQRRQRLNSCKNMNELLSVWNELHQDFGKPLFHEYVAMMEKLDKWREKGKFDQIYSKFLQHVVHYVHKKEKLKYLESVGSNPTESEINEYDDKTANIPEISRFVKWEHLDIMQPTFVALIMQCAEKARDFDTVNDWMRIYLLQQWPFNKIAAKCALECCWRHLSPSDTIQVDFMSDASAALKLEDVICMIWKSLMSYNVPDQFCFVRLLLCIDKCFESNQKQNDLLINAIDDYSRNFAYFEASFGSNPTHPNYAKFVTRTCRFYDHVLQICSTHDLTDPMLYLLNEFTPHNSNYRGNLVPQTYYFRIFQCDDQTHQQLRNSANTSNSSNHQNSANSAISANSDTSDATSDKFDNSQRPLLNQYGFLPMRILQSCMRILGTQLEANQLLQLFEIIKQCHRQCQTLASEYVQAQVQANPYISRNETLNIARARENLINKFWHSNIYNIRVLPYFLQIAYECLLRQYMQTRRHQHTLDSHDSQQNTLNAQTTPDTQNTHDTRQLFELLSIPSDVQSDAQVSHAWNTFLYRMGELGTYINLQKGCQTPLTNLYLVSLYYLAEQLQLQNSAREVELVAKGNLLLRRTLCMYTKEYQVFDARNAGLLNLQLRASGDEPSQETFQSGAERENMSANLSANMSASVSETVSVDARFWLLNLYQCESIGMFKDEIPVLCYIPLIFETFVLLCGDWLARNATGSGETAETVENLLITMDPERLQHFYKVITYMRPKVAYEINCNAENTLASIYIESHSLQAWFEYHCNACFHGSDWTASVFDRSELYQYFSGLTEDVVKVLLFDQQQEHDERGRVIKYQRPENFQIFSDLKESVRALRLGK